MKPVAIFRFSPTEGAGRFGEWLQANGIERELIALDQGTPVPPRADAFAGIGMMGGPMSANDDLPWNAPLQALVRDAVARDVPVIGHCLGGQLFAKALGARVQRTQTPEIGWVEVETPDAAAAAWFGDRPSFTTFQWHYDIFDRPPGTTRLLTNAFNPEQGFALGRHLGFQCHIEMTREMVETWCRLGADELPSSDTGPRQSRDEIMRNVDARLASLSEIADGVYVRWARSLQP